MSLEEYTPLMKIKQLLIPKTSLTLQLYLHYIRTRGNDRMFPSYVLIHVYSLIHTHFPCDKGYDLNHLRRVAKLEEVPKSLRTAYELCKAKLLECIH